MSLFHRKRSDPIDVRRIELPRDDHHELVVLAGPGSVPPSAPVGPAEVELCHDPRSPHGAEAVGVRLGGVPVGHLPRAEAERYWPVLARLSQRGRVIAAAQLEDGPGGRRLVVLLPEPEALRRWAHGSAAPSGDLPGAFPARSVD